MQLEVGKRYIVRDPEAEEVGIVWVRVDAIRTEPLEYPVVATMYFTDGEYSSEYYLADGAFSSYHREGPNDLVAEYTEPPAPVLQLGPEHVGKRVRLHGGIVALLECYDPTGDGPFRVRVAGMWCRVDGTMGSGTPDLDVIEILD